MKYALNLDKTTNRVLSTCRVLSIGKYDGMPIVDKLPDGNVYDYKYVGGNFVHDPLPKTAEPEAEATLEERVAQNEADIAFLAMMAEIDMGV